MKHLFTNGNNDYVAADTREQAHAYYIGQGHAGGFDEHGIEDWAQVPDDRQVKILMNPPKDPVTKTAAAWAAEYSEPMLASTEDW